MDFAYERILSHGRRPISPDNIILMCDSTHWLILSDLTRLIPFVDWCQSGVIHQSNIPKSLFFKEKFPYLTKQKHFLKKLQTTERYNEVTKSRKVKVNYNGRIF